ncbi:MAG: hypothetical protein A2Y73_04995 [Chloroflexi bacterium RBG_13_56_8]|nr:MAG: hypothetical protein A2Y73_04995 [Chloroflexi bacterium RBG_13_56_8]
MSRIINTDSPGNKRNGLRRTIAEMLRRLSVKQELDEEAKDLAAATVFCLREIADTIEITTTAWEKRDYYLKADRFRLQWEWVIPAADRLQRIMVKGMWEDLPRELASLAPHFSDIRILKMTRPPSIWEASYRLLMQKASA